MNKRSPAFRERNLDASTLNPDEAIALIAEDANFLRRPLILRGEDAVFGWNEEALEQLVR